jgi:hypothetical protein
MLSHHPSDNRTWMDAHCFIAGLSSENASKERHAKRRSDKGIRKLFRISYLLSLILMKNFPPIEIL